MITPSGIGWFKQNQIKISNDEASSADSIDTYLQALGNNDAREKLYYSQEQSFDSDELARVINEKRLNELLAQGDYFLKEINSEIAQFDDLNHVEQKK